MSEELTKIVKMISQNKSIQEISKMTGLTYKQLYSRLSILRDKGYQIIPSFDMLGKTKYGFDMSFDKSSDISIDSDKNNSYVRFLAISDTHFGHKSDNLDYINDVYDYCIKNGIHIIFNAGDLFEGIYPDKKSSIIEDPQEQIEYVLKNYPFDKNILNFVLMGNHDASFLLKEGIDVTKAIESRRGDIIPTGYGYSKTIVDECPVMMIHEIKKNPLDIPKEEGLILRGHAHKFKTMEPKDKLITLYVPSLSNVIPGDNKEMALPGFIDITLTKDGNNLSNEYFQHFIFVDGKIVRAGEYQAIEEIKLVKKQ